MVAARAGAERVPVPVAQHGLRVAEGLRLAPTFRLAFVTPSHQQPLGMVMGLVPGFGGVTPAQIEHGVAVLAQVLERSA